MQLIFGRQISRRSPAERSSGDRAEKLELHWAWLGVFILALALCGGSSRPDAIQSVLLQPIAALLLIPSIVNVRSRDLKRGKALCIFFATLSVWMALQLVPLPPGLWSRLPSRDVISEIDKFAGIDGIWRPISLTPFRGLDSLLGMIVPISALLLALAMRCSSRLLLISIVAIGLINAAFGMLQVVGGAQSMFYHYAYTLKGVPAGIFANENHSSVFSAIVLLIVTRLALDQRNERFPSWMRFLLAPSFILILLSALLTGSRAGFAATLAALGTSLVMIWLAKAPSLTAQNRKVNVPIWRRPVGITLGSCVIAIFLIMIVLLWFERIPAIDEFVKRGSFEDIRWSFFPIVITMASEYWFVGTGFGSFDAVYHLYEPTALLFPVYLNQAHNDWLQVVVEGGLPSIIIFVGILMWIIRAVLLSGGRTRLGRERLIFWVVSLAIIGVASFVDYPLRTPAFQVAAVWLLLCLSADRDEGTGGSQAREPRLSP